jgi:hypothetical protein
MKRSATARPIPELAPVTTATLPSSLPVTGTSSDLVEGVPALAIGRIAGKRWAVARNTFET